MVLDSKEDVRWSNNKTATDLNTPWRPNMDTKKQGLLDQFVSMTNTAPEFAQSFLEASEWNFENALNLYLGMVLQDLQFT